MNTETQVKSRVTDSKGNVNYQRDPYARIAFGFSYAHKMCKLCKRGKSKEDQLGEVGLRLEWVVDSGGPHKRWFCTNCINSEPMTANEMKTINTRSPLDDGNSRRR